MNALLECSLATFCRRASAVCLFGLLAGHLSAATNDLAVLISERADPVPLQTWIEYTVTVTNSGPDAAADVMLTNTLPLGPSLVSARVSPGACSTAAGEVRCQFGTIAAFSTASLYLQLQPAATGTLTNRASVTSSGQDLNSANDSSLETTTVSSNLFYPIGPMNVGRYQHTSLLLPDGRVLLCCGGARTLTLYDPVTLSFSMVPGVTNTYAPQAAVLLTNGTVLLVTATGTYAELFNPLTSVLSRTPDLAANRSSPIATLLADGRVLVVGGDIYEPRAEVYDPGADTWSVQGSLGVTRIAQTATRLASGKVLIAGGFSVNGVLQTAELFDPATGLFAPTGDMHQPRYCHTATLLPNGKVLVVGGEPLWTPGTEVAELYDPATGTFAVAGTLNRVRSRHTATLLPNNTVLFTGGTGNSSPSGYLTSAEIYDVASGLFSLTVDLNVPREGHSAVLLTNGAVLVTGGANSTFLPTSSMFTAELYDSLGLYNPPALSVANASLAEGNSGTNNMMFALQLSRTSAVPVTVSYATTNGTARSWFYTFSDGDYVDVSGSVTFPPGITNQTVPVPIRGDTIFEPDETFTLNIGYPTYALIAGRMATGTILNDDPPPAVSIAAVTNAVPERDSGVSYARFVVSLSAASAIGASVDYSTADQTAVAGSDYLPASGTLTFAPTETNKTISVAVVGDMVVEPDESFVVYLTNARNATIGFGQAACSILNDDGLPGRVHHFELSAVASPQLQTVPFPLTITARDFNGDTVTTFTGPVSLNTQTTNFSAFNLDFEQPTLAPWAPLNTSDYPGPYELALYDVKGNGVLSTAFRTITGSGTDGIAQIIWLNGGIAYTFRVNFAAAIEGGGGCWGGFGSARLEIDNTNASWNLPDLCTGQSARGSVSVVYTPPASGLYPLRITFSRVAASDMAYATYADDVQISYPAMTPSIASNFVSGVWTGSLTALQGGTNVTVVADDSQGHKGTGNPFDIQATTDLGVSGYQYWVPSLRTGGRLTFNLAVTNRGPSTVSDAVLLCPLSNNLTFLSATNQQGTVTNSDGIVQWHLGLLPKGSNVDASIVTRADIPGGITNLFTIASSLVELNPADNTLALTNVIWPPVLTINPTSGAEAAAAATGMVFSVTLSGPSGQTISADYFTADLSAIAGADYIATNGTVTFPPFTTNAGIRVFAIDDILDEPNRTFSVVLTNLVNAVVGYDTAGGTVVDDDPPPVVWITNVTVVEGDSGTTNAVFQLALDKPALSNVTVYFNTSDGTATVSNNDYVATSGAVVFPAGTTNQTLSVAVRGNTVNEPDETFFVNLWSVLYATLATNRATCTILNDDAVPGRLDHFVFDPVPSPQYGGRRFPLTVRATDYLGNPVPFAGVVTLAAQTDQYYILRLFDDFESGTLAGWTNYAGGTMVATNATDTAAVGSRSLKLTGKASSVNPGSGLRHLLITNARPTGISFYARAAQTSAQCNRVMAIGGALYRAVDFYMNRDGRMGLYGGGVLNGVPYESNRWYRIDLTLDWTARRTTCSVDGSLVITNVPFPDDPYSGTDYISIQNVDAATNWLDQIHVFNVGYSNFVVTPPTLTGFKSGVWAGNVTIAQSATNSYLTVADTAEHVGRSGPFDLLPVNLGVLAPVAVTEGSPPVPAQVTLPVPFLQTLTIGLTSSAPSELTVPATVSIPAGQTNASFDLTIIDDSLLDGSQLVTVSAGASNLVTGAAVVSVDDNETAVLSLVLPVTVPENAGTLVNQGRVNVSAAPAKAVTVGLTSSDTNIVRVPASVVIPASQTGVSFNVTVVDDRQIDGTRTATIATAVANWTNASRLITVTDNEDTVLRLSGPAQLSEESGAVSYTARISGTLATNLTISLDSTDTNTLVVPPTVFIAAGQTSAVFTATVIDNTNFDGAKLVALSGDAPGFTGFASPITVLDNEIHHLGFSAISGTKTSSVPFAITVSARDIFDGPATAFNGPVTLTATGATIVQPTNVTLVNGSWSGNVTLFTPDSQVTFQAASTNGLSGQSGPINVVPQPIFSASVNAGDLLYSPISQRIWALVGSNSTLVPIDPVRSFVEPAVSAGTGAGRIVTSADGRYIHIVANSGTPTVRRFDTLSRAIDLSWSNGGLSIEDIAGLPTNSATVAISWSCPGCSPRGRGVFLYDNGVARPTGFGVNSIEFGESPDRLYGYNNDVYGVWFGLARVVSTGLVQEATVPIMGGWSDDFICSGGLLFTWLGGQIIDPETSVQLGTGGGLGAVADQAAGRFYQCDYFGRITAYDIATTQPLVTVTPVAGVTSPSKLIRWGTNGLAFAANSRLLVLRSPLVPSAPAADLALQSRVANIYALSGSAFGCNITLANQGPNPATNAFLTLLLPANVSLTAAACGTGYITNQTASGLVCAVTNLPAGTDGTLALTLAAGQPGLGVARANVTSDNLDPSRTNNPLNLTIQVGCTPLPDSITELRQTTTDLAWNSNAGRIIIVALNVPFTIGDCLLPLDPMTGRFDAPIPTGHGPNKLSLHPAGQFAYAGLDGETAITRLDLVKGVADLKFSTPHTATDVAVAPDNPTLVAATVSSWPQVLVFSNGFQLPNTVDPSSYLWDYFIEFSSVSPSLLYCAYPEGGFRRIQVDNNGATLLEEIGGLISGYDRDMRCDGGRVFTAGGRVFDPETKTFIGTVPYGGLVAPDAKVGRVYYLNGSGSNYSVFCLNFTNLQLVGSVAVTNVSGTPTSLIRWGADGLAFRTTGGQVFLIRTTLGDDSNQDGLADSWQLAHFGSLGAPGGGPDDDPDGDGFTNLQEYRYGLDPLSFDHLRFLQTRTLADDSFELSVLALPGTSHVLMASTNLHDWIAILKFTVTNVPTILTDPASANYDRRFYGIAPLSAAPGPLLRFASSPPFGPNPINLALEGVPGFNYEVQTSSNLTDWSSLTNFVSTSPLMFFQETPPANCFLRFYRASVP